MGKLFAFVKLRSCMVSRKTISRNYVPLVIALCLISLGCKSVNSSNPPIGLQTGSEKATVQKEDSRHKIYLI